MFYPLTGMLNSTVPVSRCLSLPKFMRARLTICKLLEASSCFGREHVAPVSLFVSNDDPWAPVPDRAIDRMQTILVYAAPYAAASRTRRV